MMTGLMIECSNRPNLSQRSLSRDNSAGRSNAPSDQRRRNRAPHQGLSAPPTSFHRDHGKNCADRQPELAVARALGPIVAPQILVQGTACHRLPQFGTERSSLGILPGKSKPCFGRRNRP